MTKPVMMKILINTAKVMLICCGLLFIAFFIYANVNPPTPGERIYMARPTQIAVLTLPEKFSPTDSANLSNYLNGNSAFYNNTITMGSKTLCVTFDPRKTDRKTALAYATAMDGRLKERVFADQMPECPVNMLFLQRMKYALCIRK
jgi:hypothetical protein